MKKLLLSALALTLATLTNAQSNFITVWTSTTAITSIQYQQFSSPAINYTWTAMPSGNTGASMTPSGLSGIVTIPVTCPANNTITLQMAPTNLSSFKMINSPSKPDLIEIKQWGSAQWITMEFAFAGCINLNVTATDIPNLSNVFNMERMFASCHKLNGPVNINSWNTSNVTNMAGVFSNCLLFNQNVSSWNTSNVTNFFGVFEYCWAFNQPLNNWVTTNGTNFRSMFSYATLFNQPLTNFSTSNATNMGYMFAGATNFNQSLNTFNTTNVTDMSYMFSEATNFNQPLSAFNTNSVTNLNNMFYKATNFNQPLNTWSTNNVTDMTGMFVDAVNFNQSLSNWNTPNVTSMQSMFSGARSFNQNIGNWDVSNVNDLGAMFYFDSNNPGNFNQNIGSWTFKNGANLNFMLYYCGMDCDNYSSTLIGWNSNTLTPNGLSMTFDDLSYGTNAVSARANLIGAKSWTITGDVAGSSDCSLTTGITSNELKSQFNVYPNPAQNFITIRSSISLNKITLTDVLGKTVLSLSTNDDDARIDLSTLNGGVYFITTNGITKKIIKE